MKEFELDEVLDKIIAKMAEKMFRVEGEDVELNGNRLEEIKLFVLTMIAKKLSEIEKNMPDPEK